MTIGYLSSSIRYKWNKWKVRFLPTQWKSVPHLYTRGYTYLYRENHNVDRRTTHRVKPSTTHEVLIRYSSQPDTNGDRKATICTRRNYMLWMACNAASRLRVATYLSTSYRAMHNF